MKNNVIEVNPYIETTVTEESDVINVQASLRLIPITVGVLLAKMEMLEESIDRAMQTIIAEINKDKRQKAKLSPEYASIKNAALYLDVDQSFLYKRKDTVFKLGKHYHKPKGESIVRWDLKALEEWIRTNDQNLIDDEVAKLLERR